MNKPLFLETLFDYNNYPIEVISMVGSSDKNIIFINGIADPGQNHLDILEGFVDLGYSVWAINMPGHGRSAMFPEKITWKIMVDIVHSFVEEMEIGKFTMSGFSMGGGVALRYAERYPNQIDELTLLSPFCYKIDSILEIVVGGAKFVIDFTANSIANPTNKPAPTKVFPFYFLTHYQDIILDTKLDLEKLSGIKVHVVVGENDPIVRSEKVIETLQGIPDVTFDIVKGLTHDIYYRKAHIIGEIIQKMIKYLALNENSEFKFK
ncbi:MAG: alpha/beta fold hydrolase [Candidatus Dojkabacteria bacterium]